MADDFVTKTAKEQMFKTPGGVERRKLGDRRSITSPGAGVRGIERRQPHIKAFDRSERTMPGSAARAEMEIVTAPVMRRPSIGSTIGEASHTKGTLKKKIAAGLILGGVAAYKYLKGD